MSTWFGVDVAKYQDGLDVAQVKREGFSWIEARASTGFPDQPIDPDFATFKAGAQKAGLDMIGYHFLYHHTTVPIPVQAAHCAEAIGDTSVPVMIDHETADGTGVPSVADAVAFADAMRAKGYPVTLWYLPHWVWLQMGSPALPKDTGMGLVASAYVPGEGYASSLYPGKAGWPQPYGGLDPVLWQFTDKALVAGKYIDADAFEGTEAELHQVLFGRDWLSMATQADLEAVVLAVLQSPAGQAAVAKAVLQDKIPNHFGGDPTVASMLAWIDAHVGELLDAQPQILQLLQKLASPPPATPTT